MRSRLALPLLLTFPLLTCCATVKYEDMRHARDEAIAERNKALEHLAGAHQDNAMLQGYAIELEQAIRALQGGMIEQARETAKLRGNCEL